MISDSSDLIVSKLTSGNDKFVSGLDPKSKSNMAGQHSPLLAILTCSDARVDPRAIFSLQIGEAFIVRVAGNSSKDRTVIGSLEYAVDHLHVQAILILGHTYCGAAAAAARDETYDENLEAVVTDLRTARENLSAESAQITDEIARENVRLQMKMLKQRSALISERADSGKLSILGAILDLSNGRARFL